MGCRHQGVVLVSEDDDDGAGARVDVDLARVSGGGAAVVPDERDIVDLLVREPVGVLVNGGPPG
jgi:hypothetical protein